jgi:7,8-dihydro-6-hydroxymethylpterin-pyrophosphokinase
LSNIVEGKVITVFQSTHATLKAEKEFKEAGIKVRTTVKPRKISSNCQLALVVSQEDVSRVREVVKEHDLDLIGFYQQTSHEEWEPIER